MIDNVLPANIPDLITYLRDDKAGRLLIVELVELAIWGRFENNLVDNLLEDIRHGGYLEGYGEAEDTYSSSDSPLNG